MYTKKLFQLVALLVILSAAVFGQTNTPATWTGAISSSWADPLNWDGSSTPGTGYDVVVGAPQSGGVNLVLTGAATCENLTITGTMNISDNSTAGVLLVNHKLWIKGTGTLIASNATKPGIITVNGDFIREGSFNPGSTGDVFFASSALQTITTTASPTLNFSRLTITSGTTVQIIGGPIAVGGGFTVNGALKGDPNTAYKITLSGTPAMSINPTAFTAGASEVVYANSSATTVAGVEYNNLTITASPLVVFAAASALTIDGTLNINIGTFNPGSATHNIKGSITIGSNGTLQAGGSFNFCGTTGTLQSIPSGAFTSIYINNSGAGVQLASSAAVTVTLLDVSSGKFYDNGVLLLPVSGASTLKVEDAGLFYVSAATIPTFTNVVIGNASSVIFNATGAQTINKYSYGTLTLSNGTPSLKTFSPTGVTTVAGVLTVDGTAAFTIPSSATVVNQTTFTNQGTGGLYGILTVAGTVGTQVIGNITGAGTINLIPVDINQKVTFGSIPSGGDVLIEPRIGFAITSMNALSNNNLILDGTNSTATAIAPPNNWTLSGQLLLQGSASLSIVSGVNIQTVLLSTAAGTITNGGSLKVTGATATLTGTYSGAGSLEYSGTGALSIGGTFSMNAGKTLTVSGNATNVNVGSVNLQNLTFSNTGTATVTTGLTILGNLRAEGTASVVSTATAGMSVTGNVTIGSGGLTLQSTAPLTLQGSLDAATDNLSTGLLTFFGAGPQTWKLNATSRDYSGTGKISVVNVALTSGSLYVTGGNLTIQKLIFGNNSPNIYGKINMGASGNVLFVADPAISTAPGPGVNAYVWNGTFAASIVGSGFNYEFPVGDGTKYAPLTITSAQTGPGYTTVSFATALSGVTESPSNLQFLGTGGASISVKRASLFNWTVGVTNSLGSLTDLAVTAAYTVTDVFQDVADVRLITYDNTLAATQKWVKMIGTYNNSPGSGHAITYIKVNPVTSGAFTPGTKILAFGYNSAIVTIAGKVYYGDLPVTATSGFGHADLVVRVKDINTPTLLFTTTSAITGDGVYSIGQVSGMTDGYVGMVSTFPATSKFPTSMIDAGDAVAAINTAVGRITGNISSANTMARIAADVNRDNATLGRVACDATPVHTVGGEPVWLVSPSITINVLDAQLILKRVADPNTVFPAGTYYTSTYQTDQNLTQDLSNQIIRVIAMGDCKVDGTPSMLAKQKVTFAEKGSVDVDAKTAFSVPIRLESDAVNAAAFTIAAKYPADKVEYKGIVSSIAGVSAYASDGYVR
ncbi:MAG: hypothetical protein NTX44_12985, partial [Ignavibacteriales bacterium]|nr:hypothetical protein [Ignavibacteriales bacterium]